MTSIDALPPTFPNASEDAHILISLRRALFNEQSRALDEITTRELINHEVCRNDHEVIQFKYSPTQFLRLCGAERAQKLWALVEAKIGDDK